MNQPKTTSFGTLTVLLELNGKPKSEYLVFEKEGRGHIHSEWEICYVTKGSGTIFIGDTEVQVQENDVCKIPPNINHWMKPNPNLEVLLVYSKEP